MHKKIIAHMSDADAKEYLVDIISMVKSTSPDLYESIECDLYKKVYGCHFNEWLLHDALEEMKNEDGSTGGHWTVDQTNNVAKQYNITLAHSNEYDWNYVMNMVYSDYYGAVSDDTSSYVKLARKFLADVDAPEGKAYRYYKAMH